MKKTSKQDRVVAAIAKGIILLVMTLFILFALVIKPTETEGTLWAALHPASFINMVGLVLFLLTGVGISGIWTIFVNSYTVDRVSDWIGWVFFASGALGLILIFA